MNRIELLTEVGAAPDRVFDLARDLDLHVRSMAASNERAVAGRVSGRLGLNEEVTWRARHFGFTHEHRARITVFDRPRHFRDSMVRGRFVSFEHDHYFDPLPAGRTMMRDVVEFESPLGPIGKLFDRLVLARYLERLLRVRNRILCAAADDDWGD